jgi:hypothetical protein
MGGGATEGKKKLDDILIEQKGIVPMFLKFTFIRRQIYGNEKNIAKFLLLCPFKGVIPSSESLL